MSTIPALSLQTMTEESLATEEGMKHAKEAVDEYFDNIRSTSSKKEDKIKINMLQAKLEANQKYAHQFRTALTHTSIILLALINKATGQLNEEAMNINQFTRDFMFLARQDDRDIYDMRVFYLQGLIGNNEEMRDSVKKMVQQMLEDSDEEIENGEALEKQVNKKTDQILAAYDELRLELKDKYCQSKVHLVYTE